MSERKTRAELEAENAALRGLLAAIGEGQPPLPIDDADMSTWYRECASRLSSITIRAKSAAAYDDDLSPLVVTVLGDKASDLREQWQRPLYYTPEGGQQPPKGEHPYPDTDGMPDKPIDYWPAPAVSWADGSLT